MSQSLSTFYRDSSLPVYLLIHIFLITAMNFLKTMYDFSRSICMMKTITLIAVFLPSFSLFIAHYFIFLQTNHIMYQSRKNL